MDSYICDICDYVYNPEKGDADSEIAPGQLGKIFLKTGFVLFAGLRKLIFSRIINKSR